MSFHSLITISTGNVSETLFVSRITFENVFVIFHYCHFLLDSMSFPPPFFFYHAVLRIDSIQFSPTVFLNRSRNSSPASSPSVSPRRNLRNAVRTFRSIPPGATKSATRQNVLINFFDISRAISRAWRETRRFVDSI